MAYRGLILLAGILSMVSCSYDLDVTGFVYTPVPVNERFEQSRQWDNLQPPREVAVDGETYHVLVAGDTHVGGTENLLAMLETGRNEGAVMTAVAGDVTTGRAGDYDRLFSVLDQYQDLPVCLIPGNHDLYFGGWESFRTYFGSSCYLFTVHTSSEDDLFLFLDTGGGTLGVNQFAWLKRILEEDRENYRHIVIITHVNFYRNRFTGSTNVLNEEILALLDLFERCRVDLVIQGHDHQRYIEEFGYTTFITLDALKDGYNEASWLEVSVVDGEVSYQFVEL